MKEENTEKTYYCDSCGEEMDFVGLYEHGHVKVEVIHTVWGSQTELNIHFCEDCKPDPESLELQENDYQDHWDTVVGAVFNAHPALNPRITAAEVWWTVGYGGGGGESRTKKPKKYSSGVQCYIRMIEQACIEKYDFTQDGPTETSW